MLEVNGKKIETDEEGYLLNPDDWDENVAEVMAEREGWKMTATHWMLVGFFRNFYEDHMRHPTMHELVKKMGKFHGKRFEEAKKYRDFLYTLFPPGPIQALCKLAGLPKPLDEIEE